MRTAPARPEWAACLPISPQCACSAEEAFETISWTQLGLQDKPTGFLNVAGFFDPLQAQLDRMVGDAFVRQQHRDVVYFEEHPGQLLDRLRSFDPPNVHKLIDLDARS